MTRKRRLANAGDLTIRLSPDERASIEKAAEAQHLPVSTWLRQLALKAVAAEREEEERRARRREWWGRMREELWSLPPDRAHADEVERLRRSGWRK